MTREQFIKLIDDVFSCGERHERSPEWTVPTDAAERYSIELVKEYDALTAEVARLTARVAELEALVVEANAAYTTNHTEEPIDVAALGLVAMCYHGADALVKVAGLDSWIRVTEELPQRERRVLISDEQRVIRAAWYDHSRGDGVPLFVFYSTPSRIAYSIATHWRPLPAPPEAE